ncbi:MAG: hypothetical protein WBL23_18980, partial [Salinisphaera sp.]|uniref:hypothetical protein n=1 Tax=Salinisphaera sp. TaxID=1914330 RepID=UPI003C7D88CA
MAISVSALCKIGRGSHARLEGVGPATVDVERVKARIARIRESGRLSRSAQVDHGRTPQPAGASRWRHALAAGD